MKKAKQILMAKEGFKYLLVALMAVVIVSGIAISAVAGSSKIKLASTDSLSYVRLDNSISTAQSRFTYTPSDIDSANLKLIKWEIKPSSSSSTSVVTFKNGLTTLALENPSATTGAVAGSVTDNDILNPQLYQKVAGRVTLVAQPRKSVVRPDGSAYIRNDGESAKIDVIVPLDVTQVLPQTATDWIGAGSTNTYAKFQTNADVNNIEILVNNEIVSADITQTVNPSGLSKITINKESGVAVIYIPAEALKAGSSNITIRTKDWNDAKEDEKEELLNKKYSVYVKPRFNSGYQSVSDITNMGVNGKGGFFFNQSDSQYYYIFSKADVEAGKTVTLQQLTNAEENSTVTFGYTQNADTNVIKLEHGKISPNRAGITEVYIRGYRIDIDGNRYGNIDLNLKIIVPYAKIGYDEDIVRMNVGDEFYMNTTGGELETFTNGQNPVVNLDPDNNRHAIAIKAGESEVRASIDTTKLSANDQNILNKVYGTNSFSTLLYKFKVIDGFSLSDTDVTVGINNTIDIKALVTDKTKPVEWKFDKAYNEDGSLSTGSADIEISSDTYTATITGKTKGKVILVATQVVNGVSKTQTCTIWVTTSVDKMTIDPEVLTIPVNTSGQLRVMFDPYPSNDKLQWFSSNPDVAAVIWDDTAKIATVKGLKGGKAEINVISEDGLKTASATVYVTVDVTGLELSAYDVSSTMKVGQYQLTATVLPADQEGVNRNVIWSSTDTSVLTVDENGLVTFKKPGYASVVCQTEEGNFMRACNFKIAIPVEEIKLDYTDIVMSVGKVQRITAEVLPIDASDKTLIWESSDTSVVTVDSNGLVTAVGQGFATILCKSYDGGYTAMCKVYVKTPVTGVTLSMSEITVRKGQVFWLNATCTPFNADDKTIKWSSKDIDICTVEQDGKVTAVAPGVTTIIALNEDSGITAVCTVTVIQPLSGLSFKTGSQINLCVNPINEAVEVQNFLIIPEFDPADAEDKTLTYTSSDESIATVEAREINGITCGYVTALKAGTCNIIAVSEESKITATCVVNVKEYVTSIKLDQEEVFVNAPKDNKLNYKDIKATVERASASNRNIIWSSSDTSVCIVNENGRVYGYSIGDAVITATAADGSGVVATCIVHVVDPVTSIRVEPDTVRLLVGDSYIVQAVIEPEGATFKEVEWTSSNDSIATVDESGEIFALSVGKCKITATAKDGSGVKGSCWVYVTQAVNISSIKINSSEIYMLTGKQRQLAVRIRPAVNTDSYDWYSTDTGIVTVNSKGVITTVGPGVADVVVESTANGVSSTCTVHSLAISRSNMRLEQYDSNDLSVLGIESGDKVTWRSSNPRIATVDSSGHVVGRMSGTCNITAVTHDKTLYCTVTVFTAKKYN